MGDINAMEGGFTPALTNAPEKGFSWSKYGKVIAGLGVVGVVGVVAAVAASGSSTSDSQPNESNTAVLGSSFGADPNSCYSQVDEAATFSCCAAKFTNYTGCADPVNLFWVLDASGSVTGVNWDGLMTLTGELTLDYATCFPVAKLGLVIYSEFTEVVQGFNQEMCFANGVSYSSSADISSSDETSAAACQAECEALSSCMYFSWNSPDHPTNPNKCFLKSDSARIAVVAETDSISGPKSCGGEGFVESFLDVLDSFVYIEMDTPGYTKIGTNTTGALDDAFNLLMKDTQISGSFIQYFDYSGPLAVQGQVSVSTSDEFEFDLTGLEVSGTGGIHIHVGTDCSSSALGHYYTGGFDPWNAIKYTSDGNGNAVGAFDISASGFYEFDQNADHAVVIHDSAGVRIACATLSRPVKENGFQDYVVLLSDGVPNCADVNGISQCLRSPQKEQAVPQTIQSAQHIIDNLVAGTMIYVPVGPSSVQNLFLTVPEVHVAPKIADWTAAIESEVTNEISNLFGSLVSIACPTQSPSSAPSASPSKSPTDMPTTDSPTTSSPTSPTFAPSASPSPWPTPPPTDAPTSPTTGSPSTSSPTTGSPSTGSPSTGSPSTGSPSTGSPSTGSPSTGSPSTTSPTTGSPSTGSPSTSSPTTGSPSTGSPSTGSPSTSSPTTGSPSTGSPTTGSPSTGSPSTVSPSTSSPSGFTPSTSSAPSAAPTPCKTKWKAGKLVCV